MFNATENSMSSGAALITGVSSGIGAIDADRLARRGHDLILVARNRERLDALARRLSDDTGRAIKVIVADLNDKADLVRVEQVLRSDASIAILVNNAGIALTGDLADTDPDRLDRMIHLNVPVPSRLALAAIPGFVARGHGTLITISSALALGPEWSNGSYSGSKAYLLNLSLRLQQELAGTGVRVQVVLPDATRTALWERAGTDVASLPRCWGGGPSGPPSFPQKSILSPRTNTKTRYATPRHLQIGLDQPRKPLPRTRLNLLCFDGRLVTTAASSGHRPRVKHRNIQQQNTKR